MYNFSCAPMNSREPKGNNVVGIIPSNALSMGCPVIKLAMIAIMALLIRLCVSASNHERFGKF